MKIARVFSNKESNSAIARAEMNRTLMSRKRPADPNGFDRRIAERRAAFESNDALPEVDQLKLGNEKFGGIADSFAFPIVMAGAAVGLSILAGSVVVRTNPEWIVNHFILLTAVVATAITVPLALVSGFREHRKWSSYKEMRSLASLDPLTGLMNRRSFSASLEHELKRMSRTEKAAAVILFDLDHFKQLNDAHGHHVGDQVLIDVASIAYSELRNPFDRLARWGGEEFIILLHDMTEETARSVSERLRQRISELAVDANGERISVAASFGGSLLRPNQPFAKALHHADLALYSAKSNGRNRVEFTRCLQLAS